MSYDLITEFLNYKIKRLRGYASLFFVGYNKKFVSYNLTRFFETYVNTYYYHLLATLDNADIYDMNTVYEEFVGLKEELLDIYSGYELEISDDEYKNGKLAINDMVDICLFICKLDNYKFSSRDNVGDEFNKFISEYPKMKDRLGNNIFKLISKLRDNYSVCNKTFKDDNPYFVIDYSKKYLDNEVCLIRLKHNVKVLQSNYKEILVEKVYSGENFIVDKSFTLFWKLSKEILRRVVEGDEITKYLVVVDDKLFQRSNINIFSMINNPIMKRYVTLVVSYNCYGYHRDFIFDLGFRIACIQDLSHIPEVVDRISSIDNEGVFDYIIITDYKEKDEDIVKKYQCREGVGFFITKEE